MSKIGLVTVLFKSNDVLEDFFKSVSAQSYKNYILYLIDNSPSDESDKIIINCLNRYAITAYKHIKSPGNIGVAAANNSGIKLSIQDGCSHVLLLNNDIVIEGDKAFTIMLKDCVDKGNSLVVPKIFYYDEQKLWMAGGYMDKWRALGVHYGMDKKDALEYNEAKYITYAPTCFMLIDIKVFDKVDLMDEKYFAYYDDTDFVFRVIGKGYKLYYNPDISILHKVSSSSGSDSLFYVYYSNRNKIYFIRKNLRRFQKYFAIAYTLVSRIAFWLRFDSKAKKKLIQAISDGFKIEVD